MNRGRIAWSWAVLVLVASWGCGTSSRAPVPEAAPRVVTPDAAVGPVGDAVPALIALAIEPESLTLETTDLGAQLRVTTTGASGTTQDHTADVTWAVPLGEGAVRVEAGGFVRPLGAGEAIVEARREGHSPARVRVRVLAPPQRSWNFGTDIVPYFTRLGCNAGGCHGRAEGQNGFHLSLFGYDPEADFLAVTHAGGGRRTSPMRPESSLLLAKATGVVPHEGGVRLARGSDAYQALLAWIRDGAPFRSGRDHGAVKSVRVEPDALHLEGPGTGQLRVVAIHEDGTTRDVTRVATYRTNDDSAATVDDLGRARLLKRDETDLIVRFGSFVVPVRIGTVINPGLEFDFGTLPRANVVDRELFKRLEALKVPPSPAASDAAFLRRVSLDLTGQQPLPEAVRRFLEDTSPDKRARKVDELMARSEFTKHWMIKLGDLLQITSARVPSAGPYQNWLKIQFSKNRPWDEMVRELMTAVGDPSRMDQGAANYALDGPDAQTRAELTAQRFLGIRMRCAQCHDHPFDVWTQDDYYGLAAFFAKVRVGGADGSRMMSRPVVSIDPKGTVTHLRTKQVVGPKLPRGEVVNVAPEEDPRQALAAWITSPDNPYFARAAVNWAWAQFFGRGLSEPADDLSAANPPVHPELLDALAAHFVAQKYDLRDLIRTIATSHAYGLSSMAVRGNAQDRRLFSHQTPRPLTAYQMADALAQATDVPNLFSFDRMADRSGGSRAIDVFDPATPSAILDTFGRCPRRNGCSVVATPQLSLRQSLLLIGGDTIDGKVSSLNGYLPRLLEYGVEAEDLVEHLYYRTLCRPPTSEERSHWTAELKGAGSFQETAEDLFWALLNSREFAFNH